MKTLFTEIIIASNPIGIIQYDSYSGLEDII